MKGGRWDSNVGLPLKSKCFPFCQPISSLNKQLREPGQAAQLPRTPVIASEKQKPQGTEGLKRYINTRPRWGRLPKAGAHSQASSRLILGENGHPHFTDKNSNPTSQTHTVRHFCRTNDPVSSVTKL